MQVSSHLGVNAPPLTLTPPTSEDRYDTGKLSATIVAASLLGRHQVFTCHWPRQTLSWGKSISIWGTNPDILGRKKVRGMGKREGETSNVSRADHTLPLTWFHQQESCLPAWISGTGVDLRDLGRSLPHYPNTTVDSAPVVLRTDNLVGVPVLSFANSVVWGFII